MRVLSTLFLLCACACTSAVREARADPAPSPPALELPPNGWTESKKVAHVLNRLAYGPAQQDVSEIQQIGVGAWIARQLNPASVRDDAVDAKLATYSTLTMSIAQAEAAFPPAKAQLIAAGLNPKDADAKQQFKAMINKDELPRRVAMELASAKLIRAVESRRQLEEVLTDFWFNHFNVSAEKGAVKWMITSYERDAIRPHLFGTFRELLGATAHHPAMMFYLDNWTSVRDGFDPRPRRGNPLVAMPEPAAAQQMPRGINENYARELLELHTLGVNGGYTQNDVRETARAFTGWSIEKPQKQGDFTYRPRAHDPGAKVILGMQLPPGGAMDDGERVLDMLASHPATAHFIATKLCKKFIADDPPLALVERIAQVFLQSGGNLPQIYAAIFTSPEFWSDAAFGSMTKKPFEVAASAVRALGGWMDGDLGLYRQTERMGEALYRAQPPTGYPESGEAWVNAGALVSRINFGVQLAANRVQGAHVDLSHLALPTANTKLDSDPDALVTSLSAALLQQPLSEGTRETIRRTLTGGDGNAMPDGEHRRVDPRLVAGLLLGSPEFQKQ